MTAGTGVGQAACRALVVLAAWGCAFGTAPAALTRSLVLLDGEPAARPSDSEEILLTQAEPDQPTTEFGSAVAFGYLNDDGLADVLVGQRAHNRIFVYLGSAAPRTLDYFDDPNGADIVIQAPIGGVDAVQQLGFSLAAADLDGDGFDDIIAGAPFSDPQGRVDAGLAFVIMGSPAFQTGMVIDTADTGDEVTVLKLTRGGVSRAGDLLGFAVGAGTLASRGDSFLAVSARGAEAPVPTRRPAAGAVHLALGSALPTDDATIDLSLASAVTFFGSDVSDAFGESVAACDVDGSGDEDLLVGAIFGDGPANAGINRGEALLFLGENIASGHFAGNESAQSADLTIYGATDGDDLGYTVACGDLNNDPTDPLDSKGEVVVSAIFADAVGEARPTAGEVYVFRGRGSQVVAGSSPLRRILIDPITMSSQAPIDLNPSGPSPGHADLTLVGATTADQLGFSLEVGDLDGDGVGDLISGARRYDRDQTLINVGATYVIRGSAGILGPPAPRVIDMRNNRPGFPGFDPNSPIDHLPEQVDAIVVGASRNDHSSFDVAAGDLDGDGVDELLVGAIGDLTQTPGFPGEAYLIWFSDGDGDGASNVLDRDSDNDGIADEEEDADGDGMVGAGETDPFGQDTDGDGIQDGTELGLSCVQDDGDVPCDDPNQPFTSTTSLPLFFIPDADPNTSTDPLDLDSDDDGLADASEDADGDGAATGLETDAALADTDADLVLDGTELGLTVPQPETGMDTNLAAGGFTPDADAAATVTVPTDADTDGDGLGDGVEDRDRMGSVQVGETDPLDQDSDDDGLPDGWIDGVNGQPLGGRTPLEGEDLNLDGDHGPAFGESDPTNHDTDGDALPDGLEVGLPVGGMGLPGTDGLPDGGPGGDGTDTTSGHFKVDADSGVSVTKPFDADTDDDGLADGVEDVNGDGKAVDPETDGTKEDTDGDQILDGTEVGLSEGHPDTDPNNFVPDADGGATKTDPTDADTDADGLRDGLEDRNRDGGRQSSETNPLDQDTDDDGLPDGWIDGANGEPVDPNGPATPLEGEDLNRDGNYGPAFGESDPRDADSDDDSLPDGLEVGLPLGGMGLPGRDGMPDGGPGGDGTDTTSSAFRIDGDSGITVTEPFDADTDDDGLPDGFISGHNPNGGIADDPNTISVYEGEDIDLNGVVDTGETNPTAPENDSDNDGVRDGVERGVMAAERVLGPDMLPDTPGGVQDGTAQSALFDSQDTTLTDPLDGDTDDDGLSDGTEDDMGNGAVDPGETDPLDWDTDDDLLPDGLEEGVVDPVADPGTDPNSPHFIPDQDPVTKTNPLDPDTDDGGAQDGAEDDAPRNGRVDSGERDPNNGADDGGALVLSDTAREFPAGVTRPRVEDAAGQSLDPKAVEFAFESVASGAADSESAPRGPLASVMITAPAAEVPPLQIDITTTGTLSWAPMTPPGLAPPAMVYNLYRGRLRLLGQAGLYTQEALGCGLTATARVDTTIPARGEPLFYLVAAVVGGMEGLGGDSDGNARPSTGICRP